MATVVVVLALALVGVVLALQLSRARRPSTLVSSSTPSAQATTRLQRQFGDDAIVVLVSGSLQRTVLTSDLRTMIALEGCLSGNVPRAGARRACRPSARRSRTTSRPRSSTDPERSSTPPSQAIHQGIVAQRDAAQAQGNAARPRRSRPRQRRACRRREQQRLAQTARQLANQQFIQQELQLALRYGITGTPSIDDPQFVNQLVYDTTTGIERPKPRFAYLFPSNNAALCSCD